MSDILIDTLLNHMLGIESTPDRVRAIAILAEGWYAADRDERFHIISELLGSVYRDVENDGVSL